jgi:hypothetical protein
VVDVTVPFSGTDVVLSSTAVSGGKVYVAISVAWLDESAPVPQAANMRSGIRNTKENSVDGEVSVWLYLLISIYLR